MTNHPEANSEAKPFWPVTFADVEEAQLRTALAATPAQRLAWAEALLEFAQLVQSERERTT
jgi:hypothetical protein